MRQRSEIELLLGRVLDAGDPEGQLQALRELRAELDEVESGLAIEAVRAGMSWRRIGAAMGISKQAAHRRHRDGVARALGEPEPVPAASQQGVAGAVRISAPTRRALRVARQEAAVLGSAELGTEHLLLGVLQCGDESAARLFERIGVRLESARRMVRLRSDRPATSLTGAADQGAPAALVGPGAAVSPLAKGLIDHALAGVAARGGGELTALDLLHALVSTETSGAARTLAKLGVAPERVRAELGALQDRRCGSQALPLR